VFVTGLAKRLWVTRHPIKHTVAFLRLREPTSLSEAEPIAQVIGKIKNEGYDVFLVLEATVGFNRHEEEEEEKESKPELVRGNKVTTAPPDLKVNQQDLRFLKSLRISLGEPKDVKDRAA
jgi:hypothetical protein